jgi:FtsP/CotA-like multicopper oxidase with cupredoxin domain
MDTAKGPGSPPLINGRRFEEGRIDEAMLLDTRQEWTIQNYSAGLFVRHPFTGKVIPGYFKMRTHFADFAGKFVNHCHILAHEDRGMMQLIEVVDNKTQVIHH